MQKGFTLVELLVVIAIIGVLASVVVAVVGPARTSARDARRLSDVRAVQTALQAYANGNRGFPNADNWEALEGPLVNGGYIAKLPRDPLSTGSHVYRYKNSTPNHNYYLRFRTEQPTSLGPAGFYCANSIGIEAAGAGGSCAQK